LEYINIKYQISIQANECYVHFILDCVFFFSLFIKI
jgi:hypothetical protein